jgi:hypothetical protein
MASGNLSLQTINALSGDELDMYYRLRRRELDG